MTESDTRRLVAGGTVTTQERHDDPHVLETIAFVAALCTIAAILLLAAPTW